MSQGVLLYAFNNEKVNYEKIANLCALCLTRHLAKPVSIITDNGSDLIYSYFDKIITIEKSTDRQAWRNKERNGYFDFSPYEETLVIDTDYFLFNSHYNHFFGSQKSLILSTEAKRIDFTPVAFTERRIAERSLDMTWATCFYFRKDEKSKAFFDLVDIVRENYRFYCMNYGIKNSVYRNDYVFSIARHIYNGNGLECIGVNPYALYTAYPESEILSVSDKGLTFLNRIKNSSVYNLQGLSAHVLNKVTILEHYEEFTHVFK